MAVPMPGRKAVPIAAPAAPPPRTAISILPASPLLPANWPNSKAAMPPTMAVAMPVPTDPKFVLAFSPAALKPPISVLNGLVTVRKNDVTPPTILDPMPDPTAFAEESPSFDAGKNILTKSTPPVLMPLKPPMTELYRSCAVLMPRLVIDVVLAPVGPRTMPLAIAENNELTMTPPRASVAAPIPAATSGLSTASYVAAHTL